MNKREFLRACSFGLAGAVVEACPFASSVRATVGNPGDENDEPGKWSKIAEFVVPAGSSVKCVKCPNECVLPRGATGRCRNRTNFGGTVYSTAYGNPCAVHIDPIEKKPFYHFLPSTQAYSIAVAGCNLACLNCQNWQISQVSPRETQNYDLMPTAVVKQCVEARAESIAYTYSEPTTFYEYACDTARLAREHRIRNLWKSNGYIHENPLRKLCRFLDAANIDLKGFDDAIYRKLNAAALAPVLRTLKVLREEGVWLEITNLVIPQWTDDLDVIRRMCTWLCENGLADCPLHFSRFTPLYKLYHLPATPVSVLDQARDIAVRAGCHFVYVGNVPGHKAESTYCPQCGKQVLERHGYTIGQNNLKEGKCGFCRQAIPGVWV
jgi:pyruvate formate lyase activating enzyme